MTGTINRALVVSSTEVCQRLTGAIHRKRRQRGDWDTKGSALQAALTSSIPGLDSNRTLEDHYVDATAVTLDNEDETGIFGEDEDESQGYDADKAGADASIFGGNDGTGGDDAGEAGSIANLFAESDGDHGGELGKEPRLKRVKVEYKNQALGDSEQQQINA
ncbi:hypothetical protein MMC18_000065 [Xylographa bjoerkii]|nr:hypothetical protein [Xylographa bjoerkii]